MLEGAHDDEMRLVLTAFLGALRAREGRFDVAAGLDREAAALLTANVGPSAVVSANTARAEFALLRGDPEAARAIVRETREAISWGGIVCYPSMLLVGMQAEADLAERARAARARRRGRARPWRRRGALRLDRGRRLAALVPVRVPRG